MSHSHCQHYCRIISLSILFVTVSTPKSYSTSIITADTCWLLFPLCWNLLLANAIHTVCHINNPNVIHMANVKYNSSTILWKTSLNTNHNKNPNHNFKYEFFFVFLLQTTIISNTSDLIHFCNLHLLNYVRTSSEVATKICFNDFYSSSNKLLSLKAFFKL